jgi:hypothetical protein
MAARAAKAQEDIAAKQVAIDAKLDRVLVLLEALMTETSPPKTAARKAAVNDADD